MIRAPRGVGILRVDPFPYTVLWSRGITPAQIAAFRRLNPRRPIPDTFDGEGARARAFEFERFTWIVYFVRPTWADVIHESVHAFGQAVRYAEALHEVPLGGELEAYSVDRLASRMGIDVKALARIP